MASMLLTPLTPLTLRIKVLGVSRLFEPIENIHGEHPQVIPDTLFTEDLHYHVSSGLLLGASEGDSKTRNTWFPPMENYKEPESIGQGTIVVIDPKTSRATRLKLLNFEGPFNTHGIDIYSTDDDGKSLLIAAINHLPNPDYYSTASRPKGSKISKTRSRLEIFRHAIGSSEATHIRSVWHPLIRTPNDVLFASQNEIYVTNDHCHPEGLKRVFEDVAYGTIAPWTDLIHLRFDETVTDDDAAGVTGTVANKGIHNNNGLGRGKTWSEIMICRTSIGQLLLAEADEEHPPSLKINETIQLPCTLDNPSYFHDPFAAKTGRDASGYVLAGLARAIAFPNGLDPVMVWLVQPKATDSGSKSHAKHGEYWTKRLVFQDDGHIIRTASTAVLVAINPDENGGKKQARLFVTGPLAKGVVVSTIDI